VISTALGGHFVSYLTRHPWSMALLVEACGPTAPRGTSARSSEPGSWSADEPWILNRQRGLGLPNAVRPSRDSVRPPRILVRPSRDFVSPSRISDENSRVSYGPSRISAAPSRILVMPSRGAPEIRGGRMKIREGETRIVRGKLGENEAENRLEWAP
jgi:hypothetical protein